MTTSVANGWTSGEVNLGFETTGTIFRNLSPAQLYEEAIRRDEVVLEANGPIMAKTGQHTGRSAKDKFVVRDDQTADSIWWGEVNQEISGTNFDSVEAAVVEDLKQRDLFVLDCYAGADPEHRLQVRIVTCQAWHNLFARNMLIPVTDRDELAGFVPQFTLLHAPQVNADPQTQGTRSETFVLADFTRNKAVIGGTYYAGEIKKTIFTVMNKLLTEKGVLSMHCSANYGETKDDVALFFGLSGTGKTTLSADSERTLIGDDEHGWSDSGVFNIEGGCYAKVINLSAEGEPEIFEASRQFGTILENVVYDPITRKVDFDDGSLTENTRSSYPVSHIPNMDPGGAAGHPKHVIFLTADAFGVLPPIAKLDKAQAMYHYLSGYTAKVAGTEMGVTEPTATFSACFGSPFLPLHPNTYAELFGELLDKHGPQVWLVNTGWTGGAYGDGERMKLSYTRRMVHAALGNELNNVATEQDPIFGVHVPTAIEGVPSELLMPRNAWSDAAAYETKAKQLAQMFADNFAKYADVASEDVRAAGPNI